MAVVDEPSKHVKCRVSVHDRTQIETLFTYAFSQQALSHTEEYKVEGFLFLPPAMGMGPDSYSIERFYGDLRPLLRLRSPRLSYRELDPANPQSPLFEIKQFLERMRYLAANQAIEDHELNQVLDNIRLFSCTFMAYFLRRIRRRRQRLNRLLSRLETQPSSVKDEEINKLASDCIKTLVRGHHLLQALRSFITLTEAIDRDVALRVLDELRHANEYGSYGFRDGVAGLLATLQRAPTGARSFETLGAKLRAYVRLEQWYFRKANFIWIHEQSGGDKQERYVYRRRVLKRHMQKVLYLNIRTKPLFSFQRQVGAMFAAGMAAVWWLLAEIFLIRNRDNLSSLLGLSGFLMITAFVLAYILKDRIKELGRGYLRRGLISDLPDNSNRIYYEGHGGERIPIGAMQESANFIRVDRVPDDIRQMRSILELGGFEEELADNVIHYQKLIRLNTRTIRRVVAPIKAVYDILRLNVSNFLPRLDDPDQTELIPKRDGRVIEQSMPKVYYLDFILRYSRLGGPNKRAPSYDFIRLVLNKKGLLKIKRPLEALFNER